MYNDATREASARAEAAQYMQLVQGYDTGGREKISQLHDSQMKHYLRENTQLEKVLPSQPAQRENLEVGPNTDTLYYRIHMQFEGRAFLTTFESLPTETQAVYVPRIFMSFLAISSPKYVINEFNMDAYPFPLAKQVEDQIGMDMAEAKEWVMHDRLNELIQASRSTYDNVLRGEQAKADIAMNGNNTGFRGQIERDDILALRKYFEGSRSKIAAILAVRTDFTDLERFKIDDFGSGLLGSIFQDGYTSEGVHGVKFILTIKQDERQLDVFRPGNLYAFSDPESVGRNYSLRDPKFYVDKDHQFLYFDAMMAFGFIWAVPSRICKLELYNGGRDLQGNVIQGASPTSDALVGSPEEATQKDYFDVTLGLRRPSIPFM